MVKIQRLLDDANRDWDALVWEGTFEDYLGIVVANPELARHSHARIYDMLQWAGKTLGPGGIPRYDLFEGEIFGMDGPLDRLVEYFHAASRSPEVRKRILLLIGPPASGKSSIVNLIKAGLERYTRTAQGAVYAITGCPMQEDPLHLIPDERRSYIARDHGIKIEGDLCPRCRYNLRHEYGGDIGMVRVQRVVFSQSAGVGMGSFVATSPHSQDISRLVGSVDLADITEDRAHGVSKGVRLDGELQAANRGIMDFVEIFKSDERFLTVMLGVTQEQVIKLGSLGSVHADEVIVAHSNEEEYNSFISNKETAALLDRLILVRVPYNLRVSEEEKVYSKLLVAGQSRACPDRRGDHLGIAPLTLRMAAVLAVLSRMEAPGRAGSFPRLSLLERMRLYDDLVLPPYSREDVERLKDEGTREGMFGLSPRYVINRLADAMTRERACLTPPNALKSLGEGLVERAGTAKGERDTLIALVQDAVREYQQLAVREVQRAAAEELDERADELFRSYMENALRYCGGAPSSASQPAPVDERLLRRLEGALNLRDGERPRFRRDVCEAYGYLQQRPGDGPGFGGIPVLKLAIENLLLPGRDEVKLTIDPKTQDPDRQRRREAIFQRLISERGYCEVCSVDLVYFAWRTLQGKEVISVKGGKVTFD